MLRMRQGEAGNVRGILTAALGVAFGVVVCRIAFGWYLGAPTLAGAAVPALVAFVMVAVFARAGGRWGFLLLWVLLLAMWLLIVNETLTHARWHPLAMAVRLPDHFVAWSALGLPLAWATVFFVGGPPSGSRGALVAGAGVWLALLAASSLLAQYAPDVGCTPRQNPVLAVPMGGFTLMAPFLVSIGFLRWLPGRASRMV